MVLKFFFIVMIVGHALAQSEPSISDALDSLPPELKDKVDEKMIEEVTKEFSKAFKERCAKNAGPDAYNKAEKDFQSFADCLKSLVNVGALKKEIEDAKPTGQVDEVFKKYCLKTPEFKGCFRSMMESLKPCFAVDERKNLNTVYNVSEQLAEFICFKEGDRIALFIAENGPECVQEKAQEIGACLNETMGGNTQFDRDNFSADSIPRLEFGETECTKFSDLQTCVVGSLETCEAPTSANIVESLFKFIRKATPCRDQVEEGNPIEDNEKATAQLPNSGSALLAPTLVLAATFATFLV